MITRATWKDFVWLGFLALNWGSAFLFIKYALDSFSPITIAGGRIAIAALFLTALVYVRGYRLPRDKRSWIILFTAGFFGATAPFALISWGQERIESGLAAIFMAFTPLATLVLAHLFTDDEKLTANKLVGVMIGMAGVIVLMGGIDITNLGDRFWRQLAVVGGAFGYAISSILMRRLRGLSTEVSAAGLMVASAVMSVPLALLLGDPIEGWPTFRAGMALLILGIFPSAIAVLVLVRLLFSVGAGFAALNNFLVPVVGVILGALFLGEALPPTAFVGLVAILTGIALVQFSKRRV